jgi:hypothetical protein
MHGPCECRHAGAGPGGAGASGRADGRRTERKAEWRAVLAHPRIALRPHLHSLDLSGVRSNEYVQARALPACPGWSPRYAQRKGTAAGRPVLQQRVDSEECNRAHAAVLLDRPCGADALVQAAPHERAPAAPPASRTTVGPVCMARADHTA